MNALPNFASDRDIVDAMLHLAAVAADRRGYIKPGTVLGANARAAGARLAIACGVPEHIAYSMTDSAYLSLYTTARSAGGAGAARRLTERKYIPSDTPPTTIPYTAPTAVPEGSQELIAEALAKLATETLDTARNATNATLDQFLLGLADKVKTEIERLAPRPVTFNIPELPPVTVEHAHKALPRVLRKALKRRNIYIYGGMGTGKTTLAMQVATILKLDFAMASSVFEEHKLFGYVFGKDYISTDFRRIYEFGGVFLFDELDRSDPGVVVAFNAALANGKCAFPDKLVTRHPDCVLIAAGNTALRGQTREFNAAQKMDSSVLDRFCTIPVEIDLDMERAVCINPQWLKYCLALREAATAQSTDLAVTPRASIEGAIAIAEGDTWAEAADGLIWKGLDKATRDRLERAVPITNYAPTTEELI